MLGRLEVPQVLVMVRHCNRHPSLEQLFCVAFGLRPKEQVSHYATDEEMDRFEAELKAVTGE